MTEDQGSSWRRIFDSGPGRQQAKDFAKGQGYAIGLALNPYRQGELIVTAGDRPPGQQCKFITALRCIRFSVMCLPARGFGVHMHVHFWHVNVAKHANGNPQGWKRADEELRFKQIG